MRILFTGLVCIFLYFQSTAQTPLNKKVDFTINELALDDALIELSETAQVNISFRSRLIPKNKIVSITAINESIASILKQLLKGTNIAYRTVNNQIVLFKTEPPPPPTFTISGYIEDTNSGEKLIGASVFNPINGKGTNSNNYGFYSITLEQGTYDLMFSYIGYENLSIPTKLNKDIRLNVSLNGSLTLNEIIVIAKDSFPNSLNTTEKLGREDINIDEIKRLPSLGGEVDLLRTVYSLSGVQTGADGVGGLQVRGGSNDQNLVLLDGVSVFNPTHATGLLSVFNTDAIKSASIIKGNIPARYGGRLSSVLDVHTKEGNKKNLAGEVGVGLISGKLTLEGPIIKDKCSFFISSRRSFTDLYIPEITRYVKEEVNGSRGFSDYLFYDLNAKINFDISDKNKIYLSAYTGRDDFSNSLINLNQYRVRIDQDTVNLTSLDSLNNSLSWGNKMANLRWNHLFSDQLFANINISYSQYDFISEDNFKYLGFYDNGRRDTILIDQGFQSEIDQLSFQTDFEYIPSTNQYWRFGFNFSEYSFQPGAYLLNSQLNGVPTLIDEIERLDTIKTDPLISHEVGFYVENEFKINDRLNGNIGLRYLYWSSDQKAYINYQPRLYIQALLSKAWSISASYNQMTQPLHLLTKSNIGLPGDIWVPSTNKVAPQQSWQAELGIKYNTDKDFMINVEAYYKEMDNVITFLENDSLLLLSTDNWEEEIATGVGWSYGVETSISKKFGKTSAWANYTLSWSERQFDEINEGEKYPFRYDRRHNININLLHELNEKINFTANWIYQTDIAFTLPISDILINPSNAIVDVIIQSPSKKNGLRLPPQHRLDLGFSYIWKTKGLQHRFNVGVYNAYFKKNPLFVKLDRDVNNFNMGEYKKVILIPVLPSISYNIQFGSN